MEDPYGHDRWCNLMTVHSERGAGGEVMGEAGGGVDWRWSSGRGSWRETGGWGGGRWGMGDLLLSGPAALS